MTTERKNSRHALRWLEHKIPPPVVGLLCAAAMWFTSAGWSWQELEPLRGLAAALLFCTGLALDITALWSFRRARTTFNPLRPDRSQALVTGGVYRISRNPMYLGMALQLSAWALVLGGLPAWAGPLVFVAFITHFQIVPEERVMATKFAQEFTRYRAQVRRWL